jgi:serine/threonine-protein kinase
MKALRVLVLFVLGGFATLSPIPTARADEVITFSGDTYAAIAYSKSTGSYGYAYNHGSRASAEAAAIKYCKADDASVVVWVHNGFCALAIGDDKEAYGYGFSYGNGATNTDAKNRALLEARKRTTNARIVLCVCSENVKPEVFK